MREIRPDQDRESGSKPTAVSLVDPREFTFPFHDVVRPGESGQGYALRMAAVNHLNGLPQLKIWLGKSRFATLDALDTPSLHRWFGANEQDLDHALGWTHTGRSSQRYVYAGHSLGRSYFLNRTYPRACFACLQSAGYCSATWDFSLNVACVSHGEVLSDMCPNCTRPLSWHRPAPGTCSCYLELPPQTEQTQATPLEIQFSAWIEHRVLNEQGLDVEVARPSLGTAEFHAALVPLMQLIWPLSLNGGMHVTFALATAAGYENPPSPSAPRPRTPLKKAQHFLLKANEVAHQIGQQGELQLRIQRSSVVIQLLADCMFGGAPPADRHLAQSLLVTVLHQKRKTRWSGVNPQLSQMMLF